MPTDSAISWGILLLATMYGCYCFVKLIIREDEKRYGGDENVW